VAGSSAAPAAAIVGIGATPYYPRGTSWPRTVEELIGEAVFAALADAGLTIQDVDGFAYYGTARAGYSDNIETPLLMEMLGIPEVTFTATLTGGGGGSAGCVGLAETAIKAGEAKVVVSVMALQQAKQRLGTIFGDKPPTAESCFVVPSGLVGPGHLMAVMTQRHVHRFGTTRTAFAEVVMSSRQNALNRPKAVRRTPLTLEEYFASPMLADPLCRLDFCLETDGAVAVITTSAERAKDLKQKPVYVMASAHGGLGKWGRAFGGMNMPDDLFVTSGHGRIAERLYAKAALKPADIDVALLYDHFTAMVIMQLEDYGFCKKGEGGPFVESGAIRFGTGSIPVNPHGGQLSEGYVIGMTHILEAVEQLRGVAINQVPNAEIALVTGGPASVPVSGLILRN
jgi:acetyl-CoA acetyltransferase